MATGTAITVGEVIDDGGDGRLDHHGATSIL